MTKVKSLEMNHFLSSLFSVFLILLAILIIINALVNYQYKMSKNMEREDVSTQRFYTMYLSIGIMFICIQFCIACSIIVGILR